MAPWIEAHPGRIRTGLRLGFAAALLFSLWKALEPAPRGLEIDVADKVLHFGCFWTLMLLALVAFPRRAWTMAALALVAYGALIEGLQALPLIGRDAEWLDWGADIAGVAAAALPALAAVLHGLLNRREPEGDGLGFPVAARRDSDERPG